MSWWCTFTRALAGRYIVHRYPLCGACGEAWHQVQAERKLPTLQQIYNNTKSYWKKKKTDRAWGCARWINTTWENLQIAKHKSVRWAERTPPWFVLFNLQIFSGGVYRPSASSCTIYFFSISNSFWYQFNSFFRYGKKDGAARNWITCFGSSITCRAIWLTWERRNEECEHFPKSTTFFDNEKCELSTIWEGRN